MKASNDTIQGLVPKVARLRMEVCPTNFSLSEAGKLWSVSGIRSGIVTP